ncbi:MAG TPA: FAD binding domain-containing protein [Herpetosiphonaceae bacterium]|nr:FAD binding domain-containing protein [Herpetosiphonaceae bacterium]
MWQSYLQPASLPEALDLLARHAGAARLVAGGTDLLVELSRGIRPTATLIDLSRLAELDYIREDGGVIGIGGLATHNAVLAAPACVAGALPLVQACWEVGAPQIRARGTVAGNLVTASPANDTITPLLAMGAELVLASARGERVVPLGEFYLGVRRTALQPDEIVREIRVPALRSDQRGLFLKLGLRRAQAISVINAAIVLDFDGATVSAASIALGCLAPTVVRAPSAEAFLIGQSLTPEVCARAGELACADVRPIDDLRGSSQYRLRALAGLVANGLATLAADAQAAAGTPWVGDAPVLLEAGRTQPAGAPFDGTIRATINGQPAELADAAGKSLLDALRENAGLTGTKEGCAEGECGACTVWLNGQAVMACLVPAPQAHNGALTTIEGLADGDELHPLQAAFIKHAAVQCGYCIPGMLMAGAKLLEERERPSLEQIQVALSGNICRCTGYRKILDAVIDAGGAA